MRKAAILAMAVFLLVLVAVPVGQAKVPELLLKARSAILLHADSKQILYAKDAHRRMYPASTTKIMTALLTLRHGRLNDLVQVGREVAFTPKDGSLIEIQPGERISVRDLLYGLMLRSGNDAAYTLGVYVARRVTGDPRLDEQLAITRFIKMMNETAQEIGAKGTSFVNPDGYHEPNHWTTAYDLALIAREAMLSKLMRQIVATTSYRPTSWQHNGECPEWENGNQLIDAEKGYVGVTGLKPGYTPQAGFCHIATASRDEFKLISVVLESSSKGRWEDSVTLLEYGFTAYDCILVARAGKSLTEATIGKPLASYAHVVHAKDVLLAVKRGNGARIHRQIQWLDTIISQTEEAVRLRVPARRSLVVGEAVYSLDGEQLAKAEVVLGTFQAGWLKYTITGGAMALLACMVVVLLNRR